MKRIVGFLMILCCLAGMLVGCSESGAVDVAGKETFEVDDVVDFVASAAQKTQEVGSVRLDSADFMLKNNDTIYVDKGEYVLLRLDNGEMYCQGVQGRQKEGETTIEWKSSIFESAPFVAQYPLIVAQHKDLAHYLSADATPVSDGNGIYHIECTMTLGDLHYMATGELETVEEDGFAINKVVQLRLYANEDGYYCGMEYDLVMARDDNGDIYTHSFRYSDFNCAKTEELSAEGLADSAFPEKKSKSDSGLSKLASVYAKRTVDEVLSYEGRLTAENRFVTSTAVGLNSDGTLSARGSKNKEEFHEQLEALRDDLAYVEVYSNDVMIGVKKDGSVELYALDQEDVKGLGWDLSAFTDIKSVQSYQETLYGVKKNGDVVATGKNAAAVSGWKNVKQLSANGDVDSIIIALKNDGKVYVSGPQNVQGATGWSDIVSVSAGRFHAVGLKRNGTVLAVGSNGYGTMDVGGWTDIVGVSAGNKCTVGIRSDGTVVAVGFDVYQMDRWTDVVYVDAHARCGIRYNGTVYGGEDDWDLF